MIIGLIILLAVGIFIYRFIDHAIKAPALDFLRFDDEYKSASKKEKQKMEMDVLAKLSKCKQIHGEIIFPGEELDSLGGQLAYFYDVDTEEDWSYNMNMLPEFIPPAKELLVKLKATTPGDEDDAEELQSQIEEGEELITEAEWIVANPVEAMATWKEGM